MQNVLIRTGHGYEESDRGRCEAFDGFEIIAAPLHQEGDGWQAAFGDRARELRSFPRKDGRPGVTYDSYAIKLGRMNGALYILMHHGGGREVWRIPAFYDGGDLAAHIIGLPERLQFGLLMTLYKMGCDAKRQGEVESNVKWRCAIVDKRICRRKGCPEIIPQWEIDLKAERKARVA